MERENIAYRYCLKHHWQAAHQKTKDKEPEFNKIPICYTKEEEDIWFLDKQGDVTTGATVVRRCVDTVCVVVTGIVDSRCVNDRVENRGASDKRSRLWRVIGGLDERCRTRLKTGELATGEVGCSESLEDGARGVGRVLVESRWS
ncbi:hypothetical protein F2Q68_00012940 [Brassica cretica]|uniref:Uncharacterized protein n=1 Tax=Brassica cretica TaxID=69181 RepID=A0A8S9HI63_BRACR|nr:hypothetical protein F2Q68_00012940 [Brassica cretica]